MSALPAGDLEFMVRLERMTRRFGSVTAVDGIDLEVRRGEMFGLIGPDGAGKTTILRVLLGLLSPHEGRVLTCGLDPLRRRRQLAEQIGYLSQRFSLYGDLSVDENISFFAEIHGVRGWKPRRDQLLALLRLEPFRKRLAERLSGGMKQKLALACTLIHTPRLLILDEPTTGVDPVSRREFWRILAGLQREGMTILLTTPYLDEAERCGRVALIDRGRLLAVDTPQAIRAGSGGALIEVIARPRRQAAEILSARPEIADVEAFGERLHVRLHRPPEAGGEQRESERIAALLRESGCQVESSRAVPPSLEDFFIERIRGLAAPSGVES